MKSKEVNKMMNTTENKPPLVVTLEYIASFYKRHENTGAVGKFQIALMQSAIELGRIRVETPGGS